jgi:hypothetical protein
MRKGYAVAAAALFVSASFMMWGCKNGNLFGGFHKRGSGDATALLSDAKAALANREFHNAKAYYESVLAKDPKNSEALYGAATATMGTVGLDMGTLLANVITAKGTSGAGALQREIQNATFLPNITQEEIDRLSILKGLDLDNLSDGIDQIVCFLLKIRSGSADGKISPKDISVLLSVGITCILRSILRPLERNVIDLRQTADGKDFEIVIIDRNKLAEICSDGTLENSVRDMLGALQSFLTASSELKSKSGSTLGELSAELKKSVEAFKTKFNAEADAAGNVPQSCRDFVNNTINDLDNLQPPTRDPGDCLRKDTNPVH